jgi:hypothetical protein
MIYIPHGEYIVTYLQILISIAPCTQLNAIKQNMDFEISNGLYIATLFKIFN